MTTGANEAAQLGEDITRRLVPWGEPERVPADGTGLLSWPRGEVSAEVAVHTDLEPHGLTVSIAQLPSRT